MAQDEGQNPFVELFAAPFAQNLGFLWGEEFAFYNGPSGARPVNGLSTGFF